MSKDTSHLSATQRDLLDAINRGVRVHYIFGMNAHAFRADTMKTCTATVAVLSRRGLIERHKEDWRGCMYRPTPNGTSTNKETK